MRAMSDPGADVATIRELAGPRRLPHHHHLHRRQPGTSARNHQPRPTAPGRTSGRPVALTKRLLALRRPLPIHLRKVLPLACGRHACRRWKSSARTACWAELFEAHGLIPVFCSEGSRPPPRRLRQTAAQRLSELNGSSQQGAACWRCPYAWSTGRVRSGTGAIRRLQRK
jgi:hypothetical protein